jgi:hypothetical protein
MFLICSKDKDVFRTDRTLEFYHLNPTTMADDLKLENLRKLQQILLAYHCYDPDLEYVQGMADLLSPILYVLRDETETFWAFVEVMKRQRVNFEIGGSGIDNKLKQIETIVKILLPHFYDNLGFQNDSTKLLFSYRWILVLFKREFSFEDTLLVWETIWTADYERYECFIAAAIIYLAQDALVEECHGLGEIINYLHNLTHDMEIRTVLERADQIAALVKDDPNLSNALNIASL